MWFKFLGRLQKQNIKVRDVKTSEMIMKIVPVRHHIRKAALCEYLRSCQRVHTLAFLQWRAKYPSSLRNSSDVLTELIEDRMRHMYGRLHELECQRPSDTWSLNDKFYSKFDQVVTPAQSFNIYSLEQIGMPDPYPREPMEMDFEMPSKEDDLLYAPTRYKYQVSPSTIFLPSRKVLLKIMRACIDIEDEADLWYNNCSYKEKK